MILSLIQGCLIDQSFADFHLFIVFRKTSLLELIEALLVFIDNTLVHFIRKIFNSVDVFAINLRVGLEELLSSLLSPLDFLNLLGPG